MPHGSNAAGAVAESAPPQEPSAEEIAEALIAAHDGDSRAAVVALVSIVQSLKDENRVLRGAALPGFARRRPLYLGRRHDGSALADCGDAFRPITLAEEEWAAGSALPLRLAHFAAALRLRDSIEDGPHEKQILPVADNRLPRPCDREEVDLKDALPIEDVPIMNAWRSVGELQRVSWRDCHRNLAATRAKAARSPRSAGGFVRIWLVILHRWIVACQKRMWGTVYQNIAPETLRKRAIVAVQRRWEPSSHRIIAHALNLSERHAGIVSLRPQFRNWPNLWINSDRSRFRGDRGPLLGHLVDLVRRPRHHACGEYVKCCYLGGAAILSGFDKSSDPYELLLALPEMLLNA